MTPEQIAAKAAADAAAAQAQAQAANDKAQADAKAKADADAAAAAQAKAEADARAAAGNVVKFARTKEMNVQLRTEFASFMDREGVRAAFDDILNDGAITMDTARASLLAKMGNGATSGNPPGTHIAMGADGRDKFVEATTISILARAGLATPKQREDLGANPYRGHKLLDIARACLERQGVDTRGWSGMEVAGAAFDPKSIRGAITVTTSDFPVLLENTLNKSLQLAYATTPDTWSQFCGLGTVSDFRPSNRYRLGSFAVLSAVNEAGEFKYLSVPDGEKASITAATKGGLINLSRQAIINDDLGAFNSTAAGAGRAAKRTVEVDVYAQLALNSGLGPTMSDTYTLFHANHGNIAATGAIAVSVFDDGRVKMASQRDVSGNDYLDLRPNTLMLPVGYGGAARVINSSQYDTEVSNKFQVPNKVVGLFKQIVDSPRLSGTRFYMFADATIAPVIEVAFLDGNQEPFVEMQQGFTVDGVIWKVRLDYGVGVVDYRGAVTGAGA